MLQKVSPTNLAVAPSAGRPVSKEEATPVALVVVELAPNVKCMPQLAPPVVLKLKYRSVPVAIAQFTAVTALAETTVINLRLA